MNMKRCRFKFGQDNVYFQVKIYFFFEEKDGIVLIGVVWESCTYSVIKKR